MSSRCYGPHAFIPASGCALASVHWRYQGRPISTVLHWRVEGIWTEDDLNILAAALANAWSATGRHSTVVDLVMTDVSAKDVSTPAGAYSRQDNVVVGLVNEAGLPALCPVPVVLGTGIPGRDRRGRILLPGVPLSWALGDFINPVLVATVTSIVTTWFGNVQGVTGAEPVVVSYCTGGAWRAEALVTPIVNYYSTGVVGSARLRGRGQP